MSATVIDRILRWRKARVGEGAHGDTYIRLFMTFLGMEQGRPTHRTEPKSELGSLVPDTHVLGCGARGLIGWREASQRRKHTARLTLAGEAVANADPARLSSNFDA